MKNLGLVLLSVAVVGSVMAIGAVHVPVVLAVALVAAAAGTMALLDAETLIPAPALVLFLLGGYSLLQALPMPVAVLRAIAPSNAAVWAGSLQPFGEKGVAWASLSLDPGSSLVECLKWVTYGAIFVSASRLGRIRGLVPGAVLMYCAGIAVAVTTIVHGVVGAHALYGFYVPTFPVNPWNLAPLLDNNNLAGYLNLGTFCGMGLLVLRRPPAKRWVLALGLAPMVAVIVASTSRGGVGTLVLGALVLSLVWGRLGTRMPRRFRKVAIALPVGAVVVGLALALLGSASATLNGLRRTSSENLEVITRTFLLIKHYPWFGVGRGAFESVFPAFWSAPGNKIYQYAEDFVVQWAAGWGLPVAAAALTALGALLRPARLNVTRKPLGAAMYVGVCTLVVQNLVDLGLEVASVAIAVSMILGVLWGASSRRETRAERRRGGAWRAGVLAVGFAGAIAAVAAYGTHTAISDRFHLERAYRGAQLTSRAEVQGLESELEAAVRRHPADPYFPLLGALVAGRTGARAMPWLARTLRRSPTSAAAHLVVGEVLASRGAVAQAMLELRTAVGYEQGLSGVAARVACGATSDIQQLLRAVPSGDAGAPMLVALAGALPPEEATSRLKLLDDAVVRDPTLSDARVARAGAVLKAITRSDPVCRGVRRAACIGSVSTDANALAQAAPKSPAGVIVAAKLLMTLGRFKAAEGLLRAKCSTFQESAECWQTNVLAAERVSEEDLSKAARRYAVAACTVAEKCGAARAWLGDMFATHDDWVEAMGYYADAVRVAPTPERWFDLALAAAHNGQTNRASQALDRAAVGASAALNARIQNARARLGPRKP